MQTLKIAEGEKKIRGFFQRPANSGIWWISYQSNGVRKREKVGRKSDALDLYRQRKTEIRSGLKLPANIKLAEVTFGTIADAAKEYVDIHLKDKRTVKQRIEGCKLALGARIADDIKPAEIDLWLRNRTRTPATANRYRAAMSLVYREAIRNGRVRSNPARLVRQRHEDNGRIRQMSPQEEQALRQVILERFPERLPELVISLKTGMRLSEQYGLRWSHVDMGKKMILLSKTKNNKTRDIPMSAEVFAAFEKLHEDRGAIPNDRVFATKDPRFWFTTAKRLAGVDGYRWHDNRHTFCSRLAQLAVPMKTIQELAGHKTIAVTARYMHMTEADLVTSIAALG